MKYRGILVLLLVFISCNAFAQSPYLFGFKGGMNVSTLGKEGSGYTTKLGYHFGFYSTSRFYQEFGLQMELLVTQQGARVEDISNLKLNYTYLAAPIFANIYFTESASIEAGLQVAYLLKATQVDEGEKINQRDVVRNWDLAGILGFNYSKPYGSIGIRYVLGFTNTNNSSVAAENKFRNKVLQLYVAKTLMNAK